MATQIARCEPSQLVRLSDDQVLTTTSLLVAEAFGRQHKNVLQKIESLECSPEFLAANFSATSFKNRGKEYVSYEITRDGFMFLVMGFTGKKAAQIKENYICAFAEMEAQLNSRRQLVALQPSMTAVKFNSLLGFFTEFLRDNEPETNAKDLLMGWLGVENLMLINDAQRERGIRFMQGVINQAMVEKNGANESANIPLSLLWKLCNQASQAAEYSDRLASLSIGATAVVKEVEQLMGHPMTVSGMRHI